MEGWPIVQIGDIAELVTKGTTPTSIGFSFADDGASFVKVESIDDRGQFIRRKLAHIDDACHQALLRSQLHDGDILFSIAGALGRTAIVTPDILPANTNQALSIIRLRQDASIDRQFVRYALSTISVQIEKARGGVAQQNISLAQVKEFQIPLPSLPEQKRIVAILDEAFEGIDKAIANTEKTLANASTLFEDARELVFTELREDWIATCFADLCDIKHGFAFDGAYFATSGDYVLLTPGNFFEEGGYRDRGEKQKYYVGDVPTDYILSQGDLLVAMTEQAAGLLGSPILVPESDKFLHNQRLGLVQIKPGVPCSNEFLFHLFNARFVRRAIHASATGVKVRHTSPTKIGQVAIKLPPTIAEQDRIVSRLDALTEETSLLTQKLKAKLELLRALKQAILADAFGGRLSLGLVSEAAE